MGQNGAWGGVLPDAPQLRNMSRPGRQVTGDRHSARIQTSKERGRELKPRRIQQQHSFSGQTAGTQLARDSDAAVVSVSKGVTGRFRLAIDKKRVCKLFAAFGGPGRQNLR